jgi:hypothetical protein
VLSKYWKRSEVEMKKLKLLTFVLCAAMLVALLPTMARAAGPPIVEYVDSDITEDTTWHAGKYYICKTSDSREPRVTNGATLTIESGATVYFSTRTTAVLPGTESDPKNPYSSLTVTNGSLVANGVTFTTVPDVPGETTWRDAGWSDIQAIGLSAGATDLSFTDCTFEYGGFTEFGTLYGEQTNGENSIVNISVSGCEFRNPKAGASAIRYDNGYNTIGSGTVSVSSSSITGYGRGVQVLQNGDDAVNTTVSGCTFSNMTIRPVEINGGRQAVVTGNTFNNFVAGQHDNPVLIYDSDAPTGTDQTVTFTGNTFNYGSGANIYPVIIGGGCKINENLIADAGNTFDEDYPETYRYIVLSRGVGYSDNHRNAVWGDAGIPYLLASEITITGSDAANKSSLTIKPGVTVCLGDVSGSGNLAVRGDLTAVGTLAKPITFTKKAGVTDGNEIAVSNNLRGRATLKHCVMDGLYRGIGVISPSDSAGLISLENCTVRNTQEPIVLNGHNVLVKNCLLIGKGIWIDGVSSASSIMIEGCSIIAEGDNSDFGVGIKSTKSVTLKNCLIAGFGDCGVSIINNSYQTLAEGAPLIENCTVSGNRNGVVYSKTTTFTRYGTYIRNSIISGNTGLDLANKVYTSGESNYPVTIADGSIAYSLIEDDGSSLTFDGSGHYEHPVLGKISQIASSAYSNRVTGDPLFADATSGDYHLKSAAGRWNGSTWVTDTVTSPCIDAGDPTSSFANEPIPKGGRINIGCYGNTAEASKSTDTSTQYSIAVSASPAAGGTVSGGGSVYEGASITVTATPNANYNFVKWTESGAQVSTSASYTFNATGNRTLVAVFESAAPPPPPPPPPSDPPVTNQPVITPPVNEIGNGESITASNLESLISDGKELIVEDDDGAKLVFDAEALKGISSQAIDSVKAEISDVSDEYQETYPDKLVFSLTVTSGDKVISNFGGSVTVSLPYELKEGEDPKNVKVWHLAADGSMTEIPCTYDPSTKKVSFIVSHFSLYMVGVASTQVNPFTDVSEDDWFYNAVSFVNENGLMTGTGEATFSPQADTSRGMIVTILWRLEGEPVAEKPFTFIDVGDGKWYYKAVAWAAENGIVDGYSADKFGPEDNITREQMAKILCSYAAYKSYDVSARGDLSAFTDSPSGWALEYMQWAVAEGLLQGKGNALLDPRGNTKRSECAAILQRFIEKHTQ